MPTGAVVTRAFIRDLERLPAGVRNKFAKKAGRLAETPLSPELDPEKLSVHIGKADVYSNRIDRSYRLIWTTELHPNPAFRLIGAHDSTYSRVHSLPAINPTRVQSLESLLYKGIRITGQKEASDPAEIDRRMQSPLSLLGTQNQSNTCASKPKQEFPDPVDEGEEQPFHITSGTLLQSLLSGSIASWMLFLTPEQKQFAMRRFTGPARVSGPSGSGKTAVLLHRARHEASLSENARVLVICYNIALANVLTGLLDRLCAFEPDLRSRIEVRHLDRIASEICGHPTILPNATKKHLLWKAIKEAAPKRLGLRFGTLLYEFLENEISTWIKGSPDGADGYHEVNFPASHPRLTHDERVEVLSVHKHYEREKGVSTDWEDLRNRALAEQRNSALYKNTTAVLVDEYQDLSISGLMLVLKLAISCPQHLFFCGDERQRIYRTSSSFRQLGIEVRGRSVILPKNHRNTQQIFRIATHMMATDPDDVDGIVQVDDLDQPVLEGPRPILAGFVPGTIAEPNWIADCVQKLLEEGFLLGDIAILAPTWSLVNECNAALGRRRISHVVLTGETASRFFEEDCTKISTYHQAKGLEFKVVFCAGLSSDTFKSEFRYQGQDGRSTLNALLYMALTRARDRLFLSFSGVPLRCLCTLDDSLVELQCDADTQILKALAAMDTEGKRKPVQSTIFDQNQTTEGE